MQSPRSPVPALPALLFVVSVALGASCSVVGVDGYDDERERLEAARAAWRAEGIDSYSYVLQRSCFCGGGTQPARVVVQDGQRVSATIIETGEPVPDQFLHLYLTVEELFEFIEDAIDREAHRITVEYDRDLGLPLTVSIDYEEFTVDEEMAFMASQLVPAQ